MKLRSEESLYRGSILPAADACFPAAMASLPETPEDFEQRRDAQRLGQKTMLEHLPKWLRLRGLRQKDVAHALGVSEPTVSAWVKGTHSMNIGQLRQIAVLLNAAPGDLLRDPAQVSLSPKVEKTLGLMNQLSDQEWEAVLQAASAIASAKGKLPPG